MSKLHIFSENLSALCLRNGFIVKSITEGGHFVYDFGWLGMEMRRNLRNLWWQDVVTSKGSVIGTEMSCINAINRNSDSSILYPGVMVEHGDTRHTDLGLVNTRKLSKQMLNFLNERSDDKNIPRNGLQDIIDRNCIPLKSKSNVIMEGLNMMQNMTKHGYKLSLPYGLAWIGKYITEAEDTDSSFRFQEEELMNIQFLCSQRTAQHWLNYWERNRLVWWRKFANIPSNFLLHDQLSNNSPNTRTASNVMEVKYNAPEFQVQLETITQLTDLDCYSNHIKQALKHDGTFPCLLQITTHLENGFSALLTDANQDKELANHGGHVIRRPVLSLHPRIAPVKLSIVLEDTGKEDLMEISHQLATELRHAGINVTCDDTASPEDSYIYNDEIGTPYCVTVLDSTLSNGVVAFRNRNTTLQEYMHISDILKTVQQHLEI